MTDQWVPGPPPVPTPPIAPLPGANSWNSVEGCSVGPNQPSITNGVIITGVPATILAPNAWGITLNDGAGPPNFSIDHYSASGALIDSPLKINGASGDVTINHDPTQALGVATKEYVDNTGLREAPVDGQQYGRQSEAWTPIPQIIPDAPADNFLYGRFNRVWSTVPIQSDAPSDGQNYARWDNAWQALPDFTTYMPKSGGIFTGPVTFPSNNSVVINGALNTAHAILGQVGGLMRWQLQMPDPTTEGINNAGANFSLTAFSTTGNMLGTWLTIARADGTTTFNGTVVNVSGSLSVNQLLVVSSVSNLYVPGGTNGQVLATNGSGILSWATRLADAPSDGQFYTRQNAAWAVAPGGMTDAPNDGTAYARKSQAWAHLTHTDITDWTATLAPYALTTAVPPASTTLPLPSGVAAVGVGTTYARADHVHPTTAMNDNRIINGDMRIDQRNAGASGTAIGYTVDRWHYAATQAAKGAWVRNLNSALALTGFPYYLQFVSSSAFAAAATDFFHFNQKIEADMVSDLAFGGAGAQPITLSFWASSSLTGTFSGSISNDAGTRSYPFTFSIPVAGTFTKIAITIPGDVSGAWVTSGNAQSMAVRFDLGSGANFRGPAGAWASANYVGATGAVSVVATNAATFNLTGVKLEIGSVATPFNRQSLAKSLADCQRYYQRLGGVITEDLIFQGYASATGQALASVIGIAAMRAAPTATRVGAWGNVANLASYALFGGLSTVGVQMNAAGAGQTTMFSVVGDYISLSAEL